MAYLTLATVDDSRIQERVEWQPIKNKASDKCKKKEFKCCNSSEINKSTLIIEWSLRMEGPGHVTMQSRNTGRNWVTWFLLTTSIIGSTMELLTGRQQNCILFFYLRSREDIKKCEKLPKNRHFGGETQFFDPIFKEQINWKCVLK